jgi:hypothetical protein
MFGAYRGAALADSTGEDMAQMTRIIMEMKTPVRTL